MLQVKEEIESPSGRGSTEFGDSVAVAANEGTMLVGADTDNDTSPFMTPTGAAWVFISADQPKVTGVSPRRCPAAGGGAEALRGEGFDRVTTVRFGTTAAMSFTINSDRSITAFCPRGTGTVGVTASTPETTSRVLVHDRITYSPERRR